MGNAVDLPLSAAHKWGDNVFNSKTPRAGTNVEPNGNLQSEVKQVPALTVGTAMQRWPLLYVHVHMCMHMCMHSMHLVHAHMYTCMDMDWT